LVVRATDRRASGNDRSALPATGNHEAKAGIARWIEFYNFQRPHQALENRAPMAVWRASVTGVFGEEAVDMTLLAGEKLGQRCALPTSPQLQQQQPKVA
jgi:putative transposase